MINKEVNRQHVIEALEYIDKYGVPKNRMATKFYLYHNGNSYPPKYVLSLATKIATGKELEPFQFNGGKETNTFLSELKFIIREGSQYINTEKTKASSSKTINICTAIIQISQDNWDNIQNSLKVSFLSEVLQSISKSTDILILPAGFINSGYSPASSIIKDYELQITNLIKDNCKELVICMGIDGKNKKEQLAIAVDKSGIISVARKFHHMDNSVQLASTAFDTELNHQRYFDIKGKRTYLAVCYDIFGISRNNLRNEVNCDFIVGVIHGFGKSGGDSDFARKGLAGAAKQWNVKAYASAVFSNSRNPTNWTSGVVWKHGDKSVKDFTYNDIKIKSDLNILKTNLADVYIRYYEE